VARSKNAEFKAQLKSSSPKVVADRFGNIPIFRGCSKQELKRLAEVAHIESVATGAALTTEGTEGRTLYVLLQGGAKVTRNSVRVADIEPGAVIGEMALLTHQPRNATVTVTEPSEIAAIHANDFDKLLKDSPTFTRRVLDTMAERIHAAETNSIY
jgi:CRP-like cAMP-binding protein